MKNKKNNCPLPGRKPLDLYDVRDITRSIKFSYHETIKADERKHQAGYRDFSTFGRDCILNTHIVARLTPEIQKTLRDIQREGDNINQIAIACNKGKCWQVSKKALETLDRVDSLFDKLDELFSNSV